MKLELKTNALSIHSKLNSGTRNHLGILSTNAHYALISNASYVRPPINPGIPHIPNNATRVAANVFKCTFEKKSRVFKEVRVSEQALIQQIFASVK